MRLTLDTTRKLLFFSLVVVVVAVVVFIVGSAICTLVRHSRVDQNISRRG